MCVLEHKVFFDSLAPPSFVIEEQVATFLVRLRCYLWLLVSLEPCQVLPVESPGPFPELSRCQVLGEGALLHVEREEQDGSRHAGRHCRSGKSG